MSYAPVYVCALWCDAESSASGAFRDFECYLKFKNFKYVKKLLREFEIFQRENKISPESI